jgi:transposase-like protein
MTPPADPERYKNHRFPGEIIRHGVWLYYRFPLSYRDVQELLFERGIDVTHEAIRQWCRKFGQDYAHQLKRRRAQLGDKWHLEGFWRVMKDAIGAGRGCADLHRLYQRTLCGQNIHAALRL